MSLKSLTATGDIATSVARAVGDEAGFIDDFAKAIGETGSVTKSLARVLGVSESTIKVGIQAGTIPNPKLFTGTVEDYANNLLSFMKDPEIGAKLLNAADTAKSIREMPLSEADHIAGNVPGNQQSLGGAEDLSAGSKGAREGFVIQKLGDNSWSATTKVAVAGGIAVGAWVAYLGSLANENNRAKFKIDKIKIERKGSSNTDKLIRKVTFTFNINDVTYRDPPTRKVSPDYVKVCVNDYLQCHLGSGGGKKYLNGGLTDKFLIKNVSGTDVTFEVPNSSIASFFVNFPACSTSSPSLLDGYCDASVRDGTVYTADVSGGSNYFILYTSFANQFAQNLVDNIQGLANIFERVITTLASAGGNAAKNVVCETVPLVCNWLTWVILVVVIVIGIILFTTIK